jgi:hypothetical protein
MSSSSDDEPEVVDPGLGTSSAKTPLKTPKRPLASETPGSVAKRARMSVTKAKIWKYFDRSEDKNILTCKICKIACRTKHSSTGPMHSHMKVHHPDEYAEFLLLDSEEEKNKVSFITRDYEILRAVLKLN